MMRPTKLPNELMNGVLGGVGVLIIENMSK